MRTPWVDPRPQYPPSGCRCVVKCDDGSLRFADFEDTWEGPKWKDLVTGFWSMAHPRILAWKRINEAEPEERLEAEKREDRRRPKEYQRFTHNTGGVE